MTLVLEASDVRDAHHWYWQLKNSSGLTLIDHRVAIDPRDWEAQAFVDLYGYLETHTAPDRRIEDERRLVGLVGEWIGQQVFGPVGPKILENGTPSTIRVV